MRRLKRFAGEGMRNAGNCCLRRIGLLLLGLFVFEPAAAQYRFDRWTTDSGLPQNTIRDIVQTRDGYLWLTTFDGLVRFDGARFTVFDKANTQGLRSNRFTTLYEDKAGTLYAGTEDNALTVYRNGVFTTYAPVSNLSSQNILSLRSDRNGELLICTSDACFHLRDSQFIREASEDASRQANSYSSPSGLFWTVDRNGIKQIRSDHTVEYRLPFDAMDIGAEVKLYADRRDNLWVGSLTGLYRLQDGLITRFTEKDGVPPNTFLRPYCEDNDGGIWFATGKVRDPQNGLARFKDGRFTFYGSESGFPKTDIGQILKDREGTIWLGTATGLYRARKQLITAYSTGQGLAGNEVYPLLETRNGDILIGTMQWVSRYREGRFTTLPPPERNYQYAQALWEDENGRIWIGVVGGLSWYENGKLKNVSHLLNHSVWAMRSDRRGNVWVGTARGLFKFNGDKIIGHYTTADGLPSNDVKVIHESSDGTLWFGTYGGLVALKDDNWTSWTTRDGLASDRVRSIYEDSDGVLWVGTYDGGLSRFHNGRFFNYTIESRLFNNGVFCILEDRRNNFWISCNKGIYRVNRHELNDFAEGRTQQINCVAYGKSDGLLNTECNGGRQPAGIKARDGRLWFPTQEGVAVVDPEAVTANPLPPPVEIEMVAVDRHNVAFKDSVLVSPSETSIDITYTALNLVRSDLIRFKYKLEGLDKDWVDAGARRTAYYSYLPPGEYVFKVIAANADGVWNTEGKTIKVIVIPPFYRRWWFITVSVAVTLSLIFFIYRYRVSQLKRERMAQQAFSRQLIASQEQERKRIAGELHDSLGQMLLIIKNLAYMGARTAGTGPVVAAAAREQFNEISDSAAEAIDQVREISYYLRPSQLERLGLTAAIEEMIEQVAESSGIGFDFEIDPLDGIFSSESEINFYRIAQECANNIVKHSQATAARVRIHRDAHGVELMVHDNGKGFDPHAAAHTSGSSKSGLGLTGIAERVRMLGGRHAIESAHGNGTTVKVRIEAKGEA